MTRKTQHGHPYPYLSAYEVALRLVRQGCDPHFVVAYIKEELRLDPHAFETDTERANRLLREAFTTVTAQVKTAWEQISTAFGGIAKAFASFGMPAPITQLDQEVEE